MALLIAIILHMLPGAEHPIRCYGHTTCNIWTEVCFDDAACHEEPSEVEWVW